MRYFYILIIVFLAHSDGAFSQKKKDKGFFASGGYSGLFDLKPYDDSYPIGGEIHFGYRFKKVLSLSTGIMLNFKKDTFSGYIDSTAMVSPTSYSGYTGNMKGNATYTTIRIPLRIDYLVFKSKKIALAINSGIYFSRIFYRQETYPSYDGKYHIWKNNDSEFNFIGGVEGRYSLNKKLGVYLACEYMKLNTLNLRTGIVYKLS